MWPRPEKMTPALTRALVAALWCVIWSAIFAAAVSGSLALTTAALIAAIAGGFVIPAVWMALTIGALAFGVAIGAAADGWPWLALPVVLVGVGASVRWLTRVIPRAHLYRHGVKVRGTIAESDGGRLPPRTMKPSNVRYRIDFRDADGRRHSLTGREEFPIGAWPTIGGGADVYYDEKEPDRAVAVFDAAPAR